VLARLARARLSALREAPWEDELFALRAVDGLGGYRMIPLYYLYLRAGNALPTDFAWLRVQVLPATSAST
jgi:hypothetical protein